MLYKCQVLRVLEEIENIGECIASTKKRVSWHFVFAGSARAHSIILEHSRFNGVKHVWSDGRRVHSSDRLTSGTWAYELPSMENKHCDTIFTICIHPVKGLLSSAEAVNASYKLYVDDTVWDEMPVREPIKQTLAPCVWSSELYARRMQFDSRSMTAKEGEGQVTSWTFTYGKYNSVHRLEIYDNESSGELIVCLDMRVLERAAYDDITTNVWEYEYIQPPHCHSLWIRAVLVDDTKLYEFLIDGCAWDTIPTADSTLAPNWFPVYSKSRKTNYFVHRTTKKSQWSPPLIMRSSTICAESPLAVTMDHTTDDIRISKRHRYLSADCAEYASCDSTRTCSSCNSEAATPNNSLVMYQNMSETAGTLTDLDNTMRSIAQTSKNATLDFLAKYSIFDRCRRRSENNTVV